MNLKLKRVFLLECARRRLLIFQVPKLFRAHHEGKNQYLKSGKLRTQWWRFLSFDSFPALWCRRGSGRSCETGLGVSCQKDEIIELGMTAPFLLSVLGRYDYRKIFLIRKNVNLGHFLLLICQDKVVQTGCFYEL